MQVIDPIKINQKKQQILEIAKEIVETEGIEKLSIRKIATKLQQTPGIIYHYYKDKEAIIDAIVEQGDQNIVHIVSQEVSGNPVEKFEKLMSNYIYAMLSNHQLFLIIMNSTSPNILSKVSFLHANNSLKRTSVQALCTLLKQGCIEGYFEMENVELRAQVILSATFGIIQRIVIEQPDNKERFIQEHITLLLQSMRR